MPFSKASVLVALKGEPFDSLRRHIFIDLIAAGLVLFLPTLVPLYIYYGLLEVGSYFIQLINSWVIFLPSGALNHQDVSLILDRRLHFSPEALTHLLSVSLRQEWAQFRFWCVSDWGSALIFFIRLILLVSDLDRLPVLLSGRLTRVLMLHG